MVISAVARAAAKIVSKSPHKLAGRVATNIRKRAGSGYKKRYEEAHVEVEVGPKVNLKKFVVKIKNDISRADRNAMRTLGYDGIRTGSITTHIKQGGKVTKVVLPPPTKNIIKSAEIERSTGRRVLDISRRATHSELSLRGFPMIPGGETSRHVRFGEQFYGGELAQYLDAPKGMFAWSPRSPKELRSIEKKYSVELVTKEGTKPKSVIEGRLRFPDESPPKSTGKILHGFFGSEKERLVKRDEKLALVKALNYREFYGKGVFKSQYGKGKRFFTTGQVGRDFVKTLMDPNILIEKPSTFGGDLSMGGLAGIAVGGGYLAITKPYKKKKGGKK